ncbi:hypothetical protein [Streptomyces sp. HC307]|uniref:hypothetical protein n=1 Tax=Streptomyces flavusporus TaxID=3385496 RepID=UPI003916EB0E
MTQRIKHPVFARFYAKPAAPALKKAGVTEHRRRLLVGLSGEAIEVGAGNGLKGSAAGRPAAVLRTRPGRLARNAARPARARRRGLAPADGRLPHRP